MPLKVGNSIVIDDTRHLENIADIDAGTSTIINQKITTATINSGVVNKDHKFEVKASDGTVLKTFYCGSDD
jgi:hypothetical protein